MGVSQGARPTCPSTSGINPSTLRAEECRQTRLPSGPNRASKKYVISSITILASAKRALQFIGEVFNQSYVPDGKRPLVSNANLNFATTRLESLQTGDQNFLDYLRKAEPITKRFVDLRNGLEHQTEKDFTVIENLQLSPKGIATPAWRRSSFAVEGPVLQEMHFFIQFLIEFCEHVFFFGLMDNIAPNFPIRFQIEQLPDTEIDMMSDPFSSQAFTMKANNFLRLVRVARIIQHGLSRGYWRPLVRQPLLPGIGFGCRRVLISGPRPASGPGAVRPAEIAV